MEEQTVDPTTVSDRAEFTKMLKKREKEAIRNQINANKIFNKQEQERKERLSQTGKAWEAALRLLKKPHSPSKSANSTTSSMETHAGASGPRPEEFIRASSVATQDSVTWILSGQAGHLHSSPEPPSRAEPKKDDTETEVADVPKSGGTSGFARLIKTTKAKSENANSEVGSSTVASSVPLTVIPVVHDHWSVGQHKPSTAEGSAERCESVATSDAAPAGKDGAPAEEHTKITEEASSFRAAMERRRQRTLGLTHHAAAASK